MRNMDGGFSSRKLIIFMLSVSFLFHISHVQAQDLYFTPARCSNSENYTSNSQFETNLNLLLGSLQSNGSRDGFFEDSVGSSPDTVYGLVQCRGDITMQECQTCLDNTTVSILQRCPNRKTALLRYEYCLVRYSNTQFSGQVNTDLGSLANPGKMSDANFEPQLDSLLDDLSSIASSRQSRYDSGSIAYTQFTDIYGLAQCTQDLSTTNCFTCLRIVISDFPNCCNRSQGARAYTSTCSVRYEIYPFFNQTESQSPPPPQQVDAPPPQLSREEDDGNGKGKSTNIVVIVVLVIGGSLLFLVICALIIIRRRRKNWSKRKPELDYNQDDMRSEESLQFDLNTIRRATNDFSDANKLGEGGFGAVYKGVLLDGQEVAVKRLSQNSTQGLQEFKNEVVLLYKLQHRNLVRLLGFCLSGEEKLLIYEYVPNRSLDQYIFDPTRKTSLNWERRYKIIGGIARGLLYLHEDSRSRIIHRDLKAGNILLDIQMNAKIADFGMAKLFGIDQTRGNTSRIAGTFGYMAPEYALHRSFSVKSDVYSFGVLLLEIISGQKTNNFHISGHSGDLISYIWKQWKDGNALEVMDPTLQDSYSANEVVRCIQMGLLCVQDNLEKRPTMSTILLMLNSYSFTLETPAPPAFMSHIMIEATDSEKDTKFKDSTSGSQSYSIDGMSYDFPR